MLSTILLIFLPASIANMIPPFTGKLLPKLNYPLDFNLKIGKHRIFGDHKTLRGLIFGVIAAQITYSLLYDSLSNDHFRYLPSNFGALLGFAALAGDAIKSFFKRKKNLKPGEAWFPFDQLDWIFGVIFVNTLFFPFNNNFIYLYGWLIIIGLTGHLLAKWFGYVIKLNDSPI